MCARTCVRVATFDLRRDKNSIFGSVMIVASGGNIGVDILAKVHHPSEIDRTETNWRLQLNNDNIAQL